MKSKLFPFQKVGVKKLIHFNGRALLADEMGLGKTIQVLKWLEKNPNARPAIVVCPAHAKWVWYTQASEHTRFHSIILNGQRVPKKSHIKKSKIIIINYDILSYWLDYLKGLNPQVLIVD